MGLERDDAALVKRDFGIHIETDGVPDDVILVRVRDALSEVHSQLKQDVYKLERFFLIPIPEIEIFLPTLEEVLAKLLVVAGQASSDVKLMEENLLFLSVVITKQKNLSRFENGKRQDRLSVVEQRMKGFLEGIEFKKKIHRL